MTWTPRQKRRNAVRDCFCDIQGNVTRSGKIVLAWLAKECNAHETTLRYSHITGASDVLATGMAEGRRQIWNELMKLIHIDDKVVSNLSESEL